MVFLAGGITGCPDWQAEARALLDDTELVVCNPRHPVFDVTDPNAARDQIEWEVEHIREADMMLFWFPASGGVTQPIVLFELGMALGRGRELAVGTDLDYCRRYDVVQQCRHADLSQIVWTRLDQVCLQVRRRNATAILRGRCSFPSMKSPSRDGLASTAVSPCTDEQGGRCRVSSKVPHFR